MFVATKDKILPTAMIGSFPRPSWFTENLRGRPFKVALGDSLYREQYMDAVACYLNEQERAGLDILTDGDSRFDLEVGGRSWFFYTIERLNSISGFRDSSHFKERTLSAKSWGYRRSIFARLIRSMRFETRSPATTQ